MSPLVWFVIGVLFGMFGVPFVMGLIKPKPSG